MKKYLFSIALTIVANFLFAQSASIENVFQFNPGSTNHEQVRIHILFRSATIFKSLSKKLKA